jgi:hypothetical protein
MAAKHHRARWPRGARLRAVRGGRGRRSGGACRGARPRARRGAHGGAPARAQAAALDGRWFAGRQVRAALYDEARFAAGDWAA